MMWNAVVAETEEASCSAISARTRFAATALCSIWVSMSGSESRMRRSGAAWCVEKMRRGNLCF